MGNQHYESRDFTATAESLGQEEVEEQMRRISRIQRSKGDDREKCRKSKVETHNEHTPSLSSVPRLMFKTLQPFGLLAGSVTPSHTSCLVDVSFPFSRIKWLVYKLLVLVICTQSIAICITIPFIEYNVLDHQWI